MFDFVGWSGCRTGRSTVPDVTESSSIHVRDWMMSRWTTTPNASLSSDVCYNYLTTLHTTAIPIHDTNKNNRHEERNPIDGVNTHLNRLLLLLLPTNEPYIHYQQLALRIESRVCLCEGGERRGKNTTQHTTTTLYASSSVFVS